MTSLSTFPGVTAADPTASIQAAFNSFAGKHADLLIDGNYPINQDGLVLPAGLNLIPARGAGFRAISAVYPNALLTVAGQTGFYIGELLFDFIAALGQTNGAAVVAVVNCSEFTLEDIRIQGQFTFGLAMSGIADARIVRPRITRASPSPSTNQAILITSTSQSSRVRLDGITCNGSGIDVCGEDISITDPQISGWQFGAGITTEDNPFCHDIDIIRGRITGAPVTSAWNGKDANNVVVPGIETWAPRTRVNGIRISGCAGVAVAYAAPNCIVTENFASGNCLVLGGAQIQPEGGNTAGCIAGNNQTF